MKSSPCSPQLEKAHVQQRRASAAKKKKTTKTSHPEKRIYSTNGIKLDQDKKYEKYQNLSVYCQRVMGKKTGR